MAYSNIITQNMYKPFTNMLFIMKNHVRNIRISKNDSIFLSEIDMAGLEIETNIM